MKKKLLGLVVTTMLLPFVACTDKDKVVEEELKISFDSDSYTLRLGETKQITLTYTPNDKNLTFKYVSTNQNLLSVSNTGLLTGIAVGKCQVYAFYDANENNSYDSGEARKDADVTITNENLKKVNDVTFYSDLTLDTQISQISKDGEEGEEEKPNFNYGDEKAQNALLPSQKYYNVGIEVFNIASEGEIPYINLGDFATILKYSSGFNIVEDTLNAMTPEERAEKGDTDTKDYFKAHNEGNSKYRLDKVPYGKKIISVFLEDDNIRGIPLYFDVKANTISSPDISKFFCALEIWNNGIPNELSSPYGFVSTSSDTKYITNTSEKVIDLSKHNLKLYEFGDECYLPLDVALLFTSELASYYYSGNAIFNTALLDTEGKFTPYFLANTDSFAYTCSTFYGDPVTLTYKRDSSNSNVYTGLGKIKVVVENEIVDKYVKGTFTFDSSTKKCSFRFGNVDSLDAEITDATAMVDYDYTFENGVYTLTVPESKYTDWDEQGQEVEKTKEAYIDFYINAKESNFAKNSYGENMKNYAYNFLTFRLDLYYGLKDDLGISTFDEYFKKTKVKILKDIEGTESEEDTIYNHFMNASNIDEYNLVLNYVLSNILGDGHTGYTAASPRVNALNSNFDTILSALNSSDRSVNLSRAYATYSANRKTAITSYLGLDQSSSDSGNTDPSDQGSDSDNTDPSDQSSGSGNSSLVKKLIKNEGEDDTGGSDDGTGDDSGGGSGAFLLTDECFIIEGNTAVIMFDSFMNGPYETVQISGISQEIDSMIESEDLDLTDNLSLTASYSGLENWVGTFIGILFALKVADKVGTIKNVVFDITVNGGGAVLVIPMLLSILSDDPYYTDKCTLDGSLVEYHYEVDLNGDGTVDSNDTYKGKYNFFILQSDFSFSCGSLFPAAAKNAGVATIIGSEKSGGGACSVAYGSDVFGTRFQISSSHASMIKNSDGTYITNDGGVTADHIVDSSIWYDFVKLNEYLNSL